MHAVQWLRDAGSHVRSEAFTRLFGFDVSLAITLHSQLRSVGNDLWQDLQSIQTDVCQGDMP